LEILKIQDGRVCHLEQSKNRNISVTLLAISMKFGVVTHIEPLHPFDR